MNHVTLMGNLTDDVRLRDTRTGQKTGSFKLAVNRPRRRQEDGSYADAGADFVWVKTWNGTAENCARFIGKGSRVLVEGRISTNSVKNADESYTDYFEVSPRSVTFLDPKGSREASEDRPVTFEASTPEPPASDDDIPF